MKCSVMFSAGLDSTTLWYELSRKGERPRGIYINAGQLSNECQRYFARQHSLALDLPLDVVESPTALDGLTLPPHNRMTEFDTLGGGCSDSCRSLTEAAILAASANSEVLYTGYTAEDNTRLPRLSRMIELAAEMVGINTGNHSFRIAAPYIGLTKAQVVQKGAELNVPLDMTWSCLWGGEAQCGQCVRCKERMEAFQTAGIKDPTKYRHNL